METDNLVTGKPTGKSPKECHKISAGNLSKGLELINYLYVKRSGINAFSIKRDRKLYIKCQATIPTSILSIL